jgi:hypothetical protein
MSSFGNGIFEELTRRRIDGHELPAHYAAQIKHNKLIQTLRKGNGLNWKIWFRNIIFGLNCL